MIAMGYAYVFSFEELEYIMNVAHKVIPAYRPPQAVTDLF